MSYAIIRNTKYKRENLKGIFRHNERRNRNYSNNNIDKEKSYLNYSIKSPKYRYDKEFDRLKEKNQYYYRIKYLRIIKEYTFAKLYFRSRGAGQ